MRFLRYRKIRPRRYNPIPYTFCLTSQGEQRAEIAGADNISDNVLIYLKEYGPSKAREIATGLNESSKHVNGVIWRHMKSGNIMIKSKQMEGELNVR